MPKTGTISCTHSCSFEISGELPDNKAVGKTYVYYEEGDFRNTFLNVDLGEKLIQHHRKTEEKNDADRVISTGHSSFHVKFDREYEGVNWGEVTVHKGSLSYKELR